MARDHSGYVGIDAGALWAKSSAHIDATDSYYCDYYSSYIGSCSFGIGSKHKMGYDVDVVGGYDFGMFRLEGELAYKKATRKGGTFTDGATVFDVRGRTTNWSAMVNGLVDLGDNNGINFSLGGGVGWAHTKERFGVDATVTTDDGDYSFDNFSTSISKSKFAWQLLAEARYPISAAGRYRPEVPLLRCRQRQPDLRRWQRGDGQRVDALPQPQHHGEPDLQLRAASASATTTASATAASAATSGDADVPGRLDDPGDGHLSGASASAPAAASGAHRASAVTKGHSARSELAVS